MTFPAPRIVAPSRREFLRAIAVGAATPWTLAQLGCESAPPAKIMAASANARPPKVLAVGTMEGRGARVQRVFPTQLTGYQDPFVLLDDFAVAEPAGFPDHPHRGFEAFTYMIEGGFHHKDNLGNDSVVETGGTQRFTAGKGARHSEMPGSGGVNRGLQLWINLPRSLKKMEPEYEPIHGDDIPENGDGKGLVTRYSELLAILVRNLHREDIRKKPVGDLYKTIAQGFGTMKPFNSQLEVVDRWAIAAYIRALQLSRYTAAHNGGKK